VKSEWTTLAVVIGGLALTGFGLRGVDGALSAALCIGEPSSRIGPPLAGTGPGVMAGLLGGNRAAAADVAWLRAQVLAERCDLAATDAMLRLVTVLDPRPLYFWLNSARMIAYDMPAWRMAAVGGPDWVPVSQQRRVVQEQARRALDRLGEARRFHPTSAALWVEQANIELNRLGDLAAAAASYRRAAEQPDAPYFAARMHAEVLRRIGRRAEALEWLTQLHPQLPPGDPAACADLVLSRIRTLEQELGVPAERAYDPLDE
jgi:tetratricopeptide (TPR) repeat protein